MAIAALVEFVHDLLEIGEGAEHRHAADRLAEIVRPVREDALRPQLPDRAGFDRAEHHLDVDAAPEQERRRVRLALQRGARARDT